MRATTLTDRPFSERPRRHGKRGRGRPWCPRGLRRNVAETSARRGWLRPGPMSRWRRRCGTEFGQTGLNMIAPRRRLHRSDRIGPLLAIALGDAPQTQLSAAHRGRRLQAGPGLAFPKRFRGLAAVAHPSRTGKGSVSCGIGGRISGGADCAIAAALDWLGSRPAGLAAVAVTHRSLRERPARRNRHGKRFLERR